MVRRPARLAIVLSSIYIYSVQLVVVVVVVEEEEEESVVSDRWSLSLEG